MLPKGHETLVHICPLVVNNGTQDILKVFCKSKDIFLSLVLREIEDVHFNKS